MGRYTHVYIYIYIWFFGLLPKFEVVVGSQLYSRCIINGPISYQITEVKKNFVTDWQAWVSSASWAPHFETVHQQLFEPFRGIWDSSGSNTMHNHKSVNTIQECVAHCNAIWSLLGHYHVRNNNRKRYIIPTNLTRTTHEHNQPPAHSHARTERLNLLQFGILIY